ncbi:hypothetical protein [Streptomyces sp. NPDC005953]|uniref:hypothetical protein n=1 Tax=Streptomyces sp. NPDC005953 TaxID=3156719 RepID=UPI0033E74807
MTDTTPVHCPGHPAGAEAAPETDEQRADREETARLHAADDHQYCDVTCEIAMPTEAMRNFVIAHGYPGTAGALAELLRRAAATSVADTVLARAIPDWEAVYEPGNVSDYLIGYANSEAAAKGAAIAWVLSQSDKTADRLEWEPQNWSDRHDAWFDLFERHDDGAETGVGVTVRRRLRPYTAADFAPEDDEQPSAPPAPADRAAILRELEARYRGHARDSAHPNFTAAYAAVANDLSHLSDEAAAGVQQRATTTGDIQAHPAETKWVLEALWRSNGEWRRHRPARATRYEAEQDHERSIGRDATRKYRIVRVETTTTVEALAAPAAPEETR